MPTQYLQNNLGTTSGLVEDSGAVNWCGQSQRPYRAEAHSHSVAGDLALFGPTIEPVLLVEHNIYDRVSRENLGGRHPYPCKRSFVSKTPKFLLLSLHIIVPWGFQIFLPCLETSLSWHQKQDLRSQNSKMYQVAICPSYHKLD